MTINEVIEILNSVAHGSVLFTDTEIRKASKIGIEALKTIKKWREQHRDLGFLLLPGETKE